MSALFYFIQQKKGLGMVCGDVGTGKTMLLHSFLEKLPASVQPIVISNPLVDYQGLLSYIAATLGITPKEETLLGLVDRVKKALVTAQEEGKTFILLVDEAHLLSDASLEHIRLLSNIETPAGKLLQILLVGQYELSHRLNQPELRQLRQRINVNRFLSPLSAAETRQYVEHRLQIAGSRFDSCFAPQCGTLIYKLTGGVPRRINHLCDTALLICMGEGSKQVNNRTLKKAQAALDTDRIFTARYSSAWKTLASGRPGKILISVLAGVSLLALGLMWGSGGLQQGKSQPVQEMSAKNAGPSLAPESPPVAVPGEGAAAAPAGPAKTAPSLTSPPPAAQAGPQPKAPEAVNVPEGKVSPPALAEEPPAPPPLPQKEPAAAAVPVSHPRQVVVKENDTLTKIAAHWFPEQGKLGLVALLLANPRNLNQDRIITGEKLNLPQVDPGSKTIQLQEGIFYAFLEEYYSSEALKKAVSRLSRQGVRYMIINNQTSAGGTASRVVIGAYETQEALKEALLRVQEESE